MQIRDMDCTILGAGGMMPMPARLTTSVMLRKNGKMLMFDAGEGIQLAIKKGGIGIRNLEVIAISHLHADHVLGLPGVLMFRAQCDDPLPLQIVGPKGIKRFLEHTISDLKYRINFQIKYVEYDFDSKPYALLWNDGILYWKPLVHSTLCLGYRFEENMRPGKFDLQKAHKLNIPQGPLYGKLQNGETIELEDGTVINPSMVLGSQRKGRTIVFATDTMPCDNLKQLAQNADLAFIEGMFSLEHEEEARVKKHSTAFSSAKVAASANVKELVLVHISPRYTYDDEKILENEAQRAFPGALIGRGLQYFEIPLTD